MGGATAEFVMVREAGNSVFMLFVAICFVDLFAGFAASLRRARRAVVDPMLAPHAERTARVEPARVEPMRAEPARTDPFTRVEPIGAGRTEPAVAPVQKAEP